MFVHYQAKDKMTEYKVKVAKPDFFRSSLKSKQDLSFLKPKQDHTSEFKQRSTIHKMEFNKFIPHSNKHQQHGNSSFKNQTQYKSKNQHHSHSDHQYQNTKKYPQPHSLSTHQPPYHDPPTKPDTISSTQAIQYKKLHDKLSYLQNKITQMKTNLQKKRQQKKLYFQKQIQSHHLIINQQCACVTHNKYYKNNPLKQLVSQINCKKNLKPVSFDPYSPRHNIYYVSEIVRAYKQQISLARQHLISSIQFLKMLGRSRLPNKDQITVKDGKWPKKPIHQDKKTVIFDLDQTLIHCNQNLNMPHDIKLPIKFPTGQIIYAGINIRPYAIQLLRQLSKSFQVIVFTASHSCYANVVLNYLDPQGKYIAHRLFRQHCCYVQKVHVKDLRVLGRDLSQTVIIDNAAYSFAFQIDNGIPIIPYYQGKIDFELKALQSYLQNIIFCKDVRQINRNTFSLHRYTQFDNPQTLVKELYSSQL